MEHPPVAAQRGLAVGVPQAPSQHRGARLDRQLPLPLGEIVVYKTLSYVPLVILGIDGAVILAIGVLWTLMLDLNHANLRFGYGPFRYVLNSPRMHVWHHDVDVHGKGGQNFGQVLSVWDWLFRTVYWPADAEAPARLGFAGMATYPRSLWRRFLYPFVGRSHR